MFCSWVFLFCRDLYLEFCICGLCWPVCERTSWTLWPYVRARMPCIVPFSEENAVTFCMYSSQVWMHYDSIVLRIWCYDHLYLLYMKYGLLSDGVPCRSASRLRMLHAMRGCCLHSCSPMPVDNLLVCLPVWGRYLLSWFWWPFAKTFGFFAEFIDILHNSCKFCWIQRILWTFHGFVSKVISAWSFMSL